MERYMAHLLKGAEYRTRQFMGSQVKNPASPAVRRDQRRYLGGKADDLCPGFCPGCVFP